MIVLSIIMFLLSVILFFGGITVYFYEKRIKYAPIVITEIESCEKLEERFFGKKTEFYAIKYGFFDTNGKHYSLTQEEKFELPIGEKIKKVLLGRNVENFALCELAEKRESRSGAILLASLFFAFLGYLSANPSTISKVYDIILNTKTNTLNDGFAIIVACIGVSIIGYSISKILKFNSLKKKAMSYCKESNKTKPSIIEIYEGDKSIKYVLKSKKKGYYAEETVEVFDDEKENDLILTDRMEKGFFEFWIFMGILILLASFALHFV